MSFPVNSVRRFDAIVLGRAALKKGYRYGVAFHVGSQCLDGEGLSRACSWQTK